MELKFTKSDMDLTSRYGYQVVGYTLNKTILEAFLQLKARNGVDFYDKIEKIVSDKDIMIIPSEEDVVDFKRIDAMLPEFGDYQGPQDKEQFYFDFRNFIINLPYFDIPFQSDGKWGLRAISGIEVVPPIFDSCKGASYMSFCDTLAVVGKDGKYWLTPRDGSGLIINAEGYDSISRSYCFAWVSRGDKCGVLNALTGATIIPCEMDWMVSNSFIGKDNKVGSCFLGYNNGKDISNMTDPIYDAIDISTGQFLHKGKWGWVSVGGKFTELPPKSRIGYVYVNSSISLDYKAERYYYMLSDNMDGVKKVRAKRRNARPSNRMNLPLLSPEDIKIQIHPIVEEAFHKVDVRCSCSDFIIKPEFGQSISVSLRNNLNGKCHVGISWKEIDQMEMAVDKAFPLIEACHRIVSNENGRYTLTIAIDFDVEDLYLPKAFISAFLYFKLKSLKLLK